MTTGTEHATESTDAFGRGNLVSLDILDSEMTEGNLLELLMAADITIVQIETALEEFPEDLRDFLLMRLSSYYPH